jgi:hypothetical protein
MVSGWWFSVGCGAADAARKKKSVKIQYQMVG